MLQDGTILGFISGFTKNYSVVQRSLNFFIPYWGTSKILFYRSRVHLRLRWIVDDLRSTNSMLFLFTGIGETIDLNQNTVCCDSDIAWSAYRKPDFTNSSWPMRKISANQMICSKLRRESDTKVNRSHVLRPSSRGSPDFKAFQASRQ